MEEKDLLNIVTGDSAYDDEKVTAFISLSNIYNGKNDLSEALKYAAMATITTSSPRADACCCIGDIYLQMRNVKWALKWYESAISNISQNCDPKFFTWVPLLKISQVYILTKNIAKSEEYLSAVELLIKEDNEELESTKNALVYIKEGIQEDNEKLSKQKS